MIKNKRMFDLLGSATALLLTWPLFLLAAVAIWFDDGGPIFFRQERVGQRGRRFRMWKFRTMRVAAKPGVSVTVAEDARVTRAGRWLRRFKVDELPQLVHVLQGTMSLVGPRPEVPEYVAHYSDDLLAVLDHRPGLTDPASVEGWAEGDVLARVTDPEAAYLAEVMPAKVRRQIAYAERATLRSDLRVILATIAHPWDAIAPKLVARMVSHRRLIIVAVHLLLVMLSYRAAYLLRFEFDIPPVENVGFWQTLPLLVALRLAAHARFGLYEGYWKHFSIDDLLQLGTAVSASSVAFWAVLTVFPVLGEVPRSVMLLDWLGVIVLVGGTHLFARWVQEDRLRLLPRLGRRAFVVGTGDRAERLLREVLRTGCNSVDVVGLVVNDERNRGRSIHRIPVVGTIAELPSLLSQFGADLVIVAMEKPSSSLMSRIVEGCLPTGAELRLLPSLEEELGERAPIDQLRQVRLEDLLGRDPIELDMAAVRADLTGRRVLITGAAGSIGSELARQVAAFGPARLALLDQAESPLYFVHLELTQAHPELDIVPVICDVTAQDRLTRVFGEFRPECVIHAAAYKHVPLMEADPVEAVRNNVRGTLIAAQAAATFGAAKFVLISTDKAVNPSSVMGATKRVAERVVLGLPSLQRSLTDFRAVRFGNVIGSAGSVIPLFERQLAAGGPVTVTHAEVERYFMTIAEAVELVLQAAALPAAQRRICMLDMGRPVRILELAQKMIALSGLKNKVKIEITGLRPGEKLREDLVSTTEVSVPSAVPKVRVVESLPDEGEFVDRILRRLLRAEESGDPGRVRDELALFAPGLAGRARGQEAVLPTLTIDDIVETKSPAA